MIRSVHPVDHFSEDADGLEAAGEKENAKSLEGGNNGISETGEFFIQGF